jgi:hypothetical protein
MRPVNLRPDASNSDRKPISLNDLVGAGEERGRNRDAERLRRLPVDDELELGRELDRQITGLFALDDPGDIAAARRKRSRSSAP